MVSVILFIIILGLLVLIHEFGHFVAAKKSGVLVEEFGIGFPPRLWGKRIGETIYSINAIPLGGFVKMYGEEYEEVEKGKKKPPAALKQRAFAYKPNWKKALIVLAGVFMNMLLGVTIYYVLLSTNGFQSDPIPLLTPYKFRFGVQEGRVVATSIVPHSPAAKAGIAVEDIVEKYQIGTSLNPSRWIQITSANQLISTVKSAQGENVYLQVVNYRNGAEHTVSVTPVYNKELKRAIIGVNLLDTAVVKYQTGKQILLSGFMHSYNIMVYNFSTIGQLVQLAFKEKQLAPVSETVSGPIGIYSVVHEVVQTSGQKLFKNILNIVGLLSLSLAIMNVLPLPALDGGRLVFVIYEWITGKRVNKTFERYVNLVGFFIIILLGILVSINDIMRLFR